MPSIASSEAAFFAHFHMRWGIIDALHDAKSVGCDRVAWRLTNAAGNKFALNAAAAGRGIASFPRRPMWNEILPSADLTRDRMMP
jgi:hypothetical protein